MDKSKVEIIITVQRPRNDEDRHLGITQHTNLARIESMTPQAVKDLLVNTCKAHEILIQDNS